MPPNNQRKKSNPPDWRVHALNKQSDARGEIGVGWNNPDGSISVVYNPFVVVPVGQEFAIRMFPERPAPGVKPVPREPSGGLSDLPWPHPGYA